MGHYLEDGSLPRRCWEWRILGRGWGGENRSCQWWMRHLPAGWITEKSWSHHLALLQIQPLFQQLPETQSLEMGSCPEAQDSSHMPALCFSLRCYHPSLMSCRGPENHCIFRMDARCPSPTTQFIHTQGDVFWGVGMMLRRALIGTSNNQHSDTAGCMLTGRD